MIEQLPRPLRVLGRSTRREIRYVQHLLRQETVGGAILLVAALAALILANSPWQPAYESIRTTVLGPSSWHLDLTLAAWAADGLLALFFLVAGIELKREFVAGDLADPRKAALPVAAAVCGVALPAIVYAVTVTIAGGDGLVGWAIPTATDIAFALAVLAVIGTHLPPALRSFLLTLAVVDDLIAIAIIAVFYSGELHLGWLAAALAPIVAWRLLLMRGMTNPVVLAVLAVLTWGLIHASGVHATVAGVLLGLAVPVAKHVEEDPDQHSLAERMEHRLRPLSAGVAVPIFAFFAAGVRVVDGGFGEALRDPVVIAIVLGLVLGKSAGVFAGTYLVARFSRAELDEELTWTDVAGLSILGGVGFTVSLLIGELAFGAGPAPEAHAKAGVLLGSVLAAVLAATVLARRNAYYRSIEENAD